MNNKTQGAMLLLATIIISSTLTYLITKAKYKKGPIVVQAEQQKNDKPETKADEKTDPEPKIQHDQPIDVVEYAKQLQRKNGELVRDYTDDPNDHKERDIIDVDIYDSNPEFDSVSYTLYSDGVLADELNEIVYDPENSVGRDTVERFNALEHNGAVYVRNYKQKMDYEILRDLRSYSEATGGRSNVRS